MSKSRRFPVTEEQLDWLEQAIENEISYTAMASYLGCCVDTLKRVLVRNGLTSFKGAKYAIRPDDDLPQWNRPCMKCGCEKARPKNQYLCDQCSPSSSNHGLPDSDWLY